MEARKKAIRAAIYFHTKKLRQLEVALLKLEEREQKTQAKSFTPRVN